MSDWEYLTDTSPWFLYKEVSVASKQYVQHISGQGEKWEVVDDKVYEFEVKAITMAGLGVHFLPKSEYRLCHALEVWKDVTNECEINEYGEILHEGTLTMPRYGYRRRKAQASVELSDKHWSTGWAVIVEQKVSE